MDSSDSSYSSVFIVLLVFSISDNMATHLLSNEVFSISSLLIVHLLRLFIITSVLSGDDEKRLILYSFPVCFSFINLLVTTHILN